MRKNKFFTAINIFGLSIGLCCCMLIALYLHYETSYDSYQKNFDDLYQLGTAFVIKGGADKNTANTPAPMAGAMKQDFPEVVETARLMPLFAEDKTLIQYVPNSGEKKTFLEPDGFIADPSFFKLFSYHFIEGGADDALSGTNTIVLSEAIAKKLFGDSPALNRVIRVNSNTNGEYDFKVTGVFSADGRPSHIKAAFFLSLSGGNVEKSVIKHGANFAFNNMFYSYLQLKHGADPARLESKFPQFIEKYAGNDLRNAGFYKKQFLIPLKAIHLNEVVTSNVTPPASRKYLYVLVSIAVFTLLIACINFMNLATARSSKRSSEVGIRKVLGAERISLIAQFIGESVFMSLIAFIVATLLTLLMLKTLNHASGREITLSFAEHGRLLTGFLLLAVLTGLIAGSYPAFYLSSFNPVKVLKGKLTNTAAVIALRKGLVVFQFMISVILIIASVVISRQMAYMQTADLGFAKDEQIVIPLRTTASKAAYNAMKTKLKNNGSVASAGGSLYYPGIFNPSDNAFFRQGQTPSDGKRTRINTVDEDFMQTLGFKVVAGRLFSAQFKADTGDRIIVNERLVKELGFSSPENAIGKNIYYTNDQKQESFTVVGVVKDFHYEDLHLPLTPYGFELGGSSKAFNYLIVHSKRGKLSNALALAEEAWREYDPNEPFEYTFLDAEFQKNYAADTQLASLVRYFTLIAILISCLGLFGLTAFSAEQRFKEIGVRKVLGASISGIVAMLSIDFLKLIVLAVIIGSPVAWWVMNNWLQSFAYRREIDWIIFVYTFLIAVGIGLLTIGSQAIKAALANPVKSLRSE